MTNREWLEGLSDGELAKKISDIRNNGSCKICYFCGKENLPIGNCAVGIKKWLKAEHKGDNQ